MTTFALAPRPPPRDTSLECSRSSSDATRPRPPRPGKGPRTGRTHRLASRTKRPANDENADENVSSENVSSFIGTRGAFAPRPPAGAPAARGSDDDAERSALLHAVRCAEEEASASSLRRKGQVKPRRDGGNGDPFSRRRFGTAFDGNRPRTPPEAASKKPFRRRAVSVVAPKGRGRTGRGGGGAVHGVASEGEDWVASGASGDSTRATGRDRAHFLLTKSLTNAAVQWAPGSRAVVRAWGEKNADAAEGKTASPESRRDDAPSRESAYSSGSTETRVGQRTARAIDALRSTRRRAWSADASPYAASLSLAGTLPPARGARPFLFGPRRKQIAADDGSARAWSRGRAGTPPKTLRRRCLERRACEARDWERQCADLEVERDALRLENARQSDAIASLTRRLAEATEAQNKLRRETRTRVKKNDPESPAPRARGAAESPVAEHLEAGFRAFLTGAAGDVSRSKEVSPLFGAASPKSSRGKDARARFPSSPSPASAGSPRSPRSPRSPVSGLAIPFANARSPVRSPPRNALAGVLAAGGSSRETSASSPKDTEKGKDDDDPAAAAEDSPPSAFLGFFPASPSRELDGVPAWPPVANGGASPGTSPPGTAPRRGARVPAAGALGVPAGFEMGGALSEDEDGGDGPAEPSTPPPARGAGEVFGATAVGSTGKNATRRSEPSAVMRATRSARNESSSQPSSPVSAVACPSCVTARARHEASATELGEALRAARERNEALEGANASLESRLAAAETELAESTAAFEFQRLDSDGDGRVGLDDLLRAELFASYAQPVVERVFERWITSSVANPTPRDATTRNNPATIDAAGFASLRDCARNKTRTRASTRFWFQIVDVDGDGVLSGHDIKWLYDAVYKDDGACVSLADLTCQIFDMAGADAARGGGVDLAALRESRLADGIFNILCNHDDMLLRRSTAEFSSEHAVPM